jgi:hypothetical protein
VKCEEIMNKLTLDLNAIEVQSFATDDAAARAYGTVHGRQKGSEIDACPSARGCETLRLFAMLGGTPGDGDRPAGGAGLQPVVS